MDKKSSFGFSPDNGEIQEGGSYPSSWPAFKMNRGLSMWARTYFVLCGMGLSTDRLLAVNGAGFDTQHTFAQTRIVRTII